MSLFGIWGKHTFKRCDVGAIETLRDALFGNPPSPAMKPSREGVLAAFSELAQLLAAGGIDNIYETTATGIAATTNGDLFLVKGTGDSFADLYKNNAGSAVSQDVSLPSTAFVEAQAADVASLDARADAVEADVATKADVASPTFETSGAFGGRLYLKKPTDSDLAGDVAMDVVGDVARIYEAGGTGRGVSFPLTAMDDGAGSFIAPPQHSGTWTHNPTTELAFPVDPDIINVILIWGQSNAEGNTTVPQTLIASAPLNGTTAQYCLMGDDCGARVDIRVGEADSTIPAPTLFNAFVACQEAINDANDCYETALTSTLTHLHQSVFDLSGFRMTFAGAVVARGGYSVRQLRQGWGAFEYSRQWIKDAVAVARADGKKVIVRAIMFRCTETDATDDVAAPMLAETYVELASAANAMAKAITAQTEDISLFLDAPQSTDFNNYQYNDLVEAQRMAGDRSSLIRLGVPYYQHPRTSTGSPEYSVHVNARGQNNTGVDYARAIVDTMSSRFAPAQPYFARLSNVAKTEITVQCPFVPAVDLSGTIISLTGLKGRYGIVFEDDSGSPPTITGHSIVTTSNRKDIVFTLSAAPTGPNPRLIVGQLPNDATPDTFGPVTGCRTAWYFADRDKTSLWGGDTVRDWFRPCTLNL